MEDITDGNETVGEPPKYESDTYYKILIDIVWEDTCLTI